MQSPVRASPTPPTQAGSGARAHRRWTPGATLALLVVLALPGLRPAPALARGSGANPVVTQKLLEKGLKSLIQTEKAYLAGDLAEAARHGKAAERTFLDVLSQDPQSLVATLLGAEAAALGGDLASAADWEKRYRSISRGGENDPDLHFLHAFVHLIGAKRPERALRSLQRMYNLNPRARPKERDSLWIRALDEHGRKLLEATQYDEAIAQFKTGQRIARRQGLRARELLMISNIGVTLMRADRYFEATDLYAGLVKLEPDNPVWHWQLGLTLADQSKFSDAIPEYREVIRLIDAGKVPPGSANSMSQVELRLGNCLRHLAARQLDPVLKEKMFEEAEAAIRSYIEIAPEDSVGHKWLGVFLFLDRDQPYAALPHLEKAYKLDPLCIDALKYMLQIHLNFPPPPEQLPADDPEAAAKARAAWEAVIEPWEKIIEDPDGERKKALDERERKNGKTGCT
jgi:tetratricopeptide (TPR) repeat protein